MGTQTALAPVQAPTRTDTARRWWWLVLAGGVLGIAGTVWQTMERLAYGSGDKGPSVCDISAIVSCTNVYSHWQSSALGVPNSLIGLPVFAFMPQLLLRSRVALTVWAHERSSAATHQVESAQIPVGGRQRAGIAPAARQ